MQAVFNHIETIKAKPHRVRKQIAFLYAAIVAGILAFLWLTINLASGSFAISNANFADSFVQTQIATVPASAGLPGAVGASAASAPAHIEIVDTHPVQAARPEQTTIPF